MSVPVNRLEIVTENHRRISTILIARLMLNLRDPKVTDPTESLRYPVSHVFSVPRPGITEVASKNCLAREPRRD